MAQNENILQRLGNLFQSNIIIKKNDSGGVVVKDINMMQRGLVSNFIDRYSRLHSGQQYWTEKWAQKHQMSVYDVQRKELFRDYELMDSDPIIGSALDIYSDESTVDNINNELLKIKTDNTKVAKILHNLFYDIVNIEFNLWSWIRNMCKYGDFFLSMDILDEHGIVNGTPISTY